MIRVNCLFLGLLLNGINAFCGNISFERISLEQGLSQVSVNTMTMDSVGNMWFGTRNGLNKYNGEEMIVYRTNRFEPDAIGGNHIRKLLANNDYLWITSLDGISRFSIKEEKFKNYHIDNLKSFCFYKDRIIIARDSKLHWLSENNGQLDELPTDRPIKGLIRCMTVFGHNLIIGTEQEALLLESSGRMTPLLNNANVMCVFVDSYQNIWIGTENKGLFKIDNNGQIKHFDGHHDLSHSFIRCIEEDDDGTIWVGTFMGLNSISPNNEIKHYKNDPHDQTSLSHNSIWTLYKDRTGAIWIGTYFGGVDFFHPTNTLFKTYRQNSEKNHSINFRVVGAMCEDSRKNLWICTEGGGLNMFNRQLGHFEYFNHSSSKNSISHNNIKSIFNEGDSILWIGTHRGGLNRLNLKSQKFKIYKQQTGKVGSIPTNTLSDIIPYNGNYLISSDKGVLHFNPRTEVFTNFFNDSLDRKIGSVINSVLIDSQDRLWIAKYNNGISCYDLKKKVLHTYKFDHSNPRSLASQMVYKIFEDHYRRIWIATSDGINIYAPESDDFETYSAEDGLAGNCVFGIAQSRFGDMILATNNGISFFNYNNKTFRNLTPQNGFPLKEINQSGLFITSDGEVFIGGIDGMTSFYEKDFLEQNILTAPAITQLFVNNKIVRPNDKSKILKESIMHTDYLELKHMHTGFSLHFSDMHFAKSNKQLMEYKLEGFDSEWQLAKDNKATYTNLDAADYTFIIRNVNSPSLQRQLAIKVIPPFYLSKIAYIIYILLIVAIILLLNKLYLSKKRLKDKLILNQSQFKFFTNISHEFRTPLTIINGQTEVLLEESNIKPDTYKKVLQIHKNTTRLNNLISELLDFRKQELGFLSIKASNYDFIPFINEIYFSFIELANHAEIDYQLNTNIKELPLWYDRLKLEKVFYNLLSNAFKFTNHKGKISINISESDNWIRIDIQDNGKGISKEHVGKIFDRFYQLENVPSKNTSGSGIGLAFSKSIVEAHKGKISVQSKPDNGSTFSVSIPKGNKHFKQDEIFHDNVTSGNISTDTPELNIEKTETNTPKAHKLLIVEDNHEVQEFLKDLLQSMFEVQQAFDGVAGLELAKEYQPDIILSDVVMPKMSGTEMCSKLKSNFKTSHIPVILLTAKTAEIHKIEGLETGADDYITKPFNTKVLIARISNIINNRKVLQAKFEQTPSAPVKKITRNSIDQKFLEEAREVILRNIDNPKYDVVAFASDMKLGRTSLFSKIKGITGQTPNNFMTTIRLNKASELLHSNPELTISEVAYSCGFSAPHYFSKSFKSKFGLNPSELRQSLEN